MSSFCPACGHPVIPGARFCTNCGAKLPERAGVEADPSIDLRSTEPAAGTDGDPETTGGAGTGDVDQVAELARRAAEELGFRVEWTPRTPQPSPRTIRLLAGIADWFIITVLLTPVLFVLAEDSPEGSPTLGPSAQWVLAAGPALYFFLTTAIMGTSPGKRMFQSKVRATDEGPIGWGNAFVRALVPAAMQLAVAAFPGSWVDGALGTWLVVGWWAVVFLPLLVDARRRGLHDRLAGTVVLTTPWLRS